MATTKRTTTRTVAAVEDFTPKKPKTYPFKAFGQTWKVTPSNVTHLVNFEEEQDLASMFKFVVGHVVREEREAFVKALAEADAMDLDNLLGLSQAIQAKAYPNIPTTP
jgi:hypothetical protein